MISYPKYTEKQDLRVKIFKSEHIKIKALHKGGVSIRAIARKYEVDKRTIVFILFPERKKKQNWKDFYNKKRGKEYMKKYRRRKMKLQGNLISRWRKSIR